VPQLTRITVTPRQTRDPDVGKRAFSEAVVDSVAAAPKAHRENIGRGALLSIDEAAARVRVLLPLR
jgi:hypothetical protein